jgi:para-nitrobenzyl esterase
VTTRLPLAAAIAAVAALATFVDATPTAPMPDASIAPGPIVHAPAGAVRGSTDGPIRVFRGIPYARPPVGELRWKPPVPLPPWNGVRDATAFGPACHQPPPRLSTIYAGGPMPMSEDCLTLNVWAPASATTAPVFFWIYGGALQSGASRDPMYDGRRLAERGVVVVSINYRLGVLGWLAHPELSAESPQHISGNYGLLDQIRALAWVKQNIAAFGGDPADVTIAGESAGALSVMYLMASPLARGLFAKGIAESAYMISTPALQSAAHGAPSAEQAGVTLMHQLGANDLAAMRAIAGDQITAAAAGFGYGPWGAVDGHVLPDQLVNVFDQGKQARVPLLAGFNSGEIRSLTPLAPPVPPSASAYESTIRDRYGDLADAFLRLYPSHDLQESIFATTRDALYGWTAERLVRQRPRSACRRISTSGTTAIPPPTRRGCTRSTPASSRTCSAPSTARPRSGRRTRTPPRKTRSPTRWATTGRASPARVGRRRGTRRTGRRTLPARATCASPRRRPPRAISCRGCSS